MPVLQPGSHSVPVRLSGTSVVAYKLTCGGRDHVEQLECGGDLDPMQSQVPYIHVNLGPMQSQDSHVC